MLLLLLKRRSIVIVIVIIASCLVLPWRKHCPALLIFAAQRPQARCDHSVSRRRPAQQYTSISGPSPGCVSVAVRVTAAKFTTHCGDHDVILHRRPTTRHPWCTASQPHGASQPHSSQTWVVRHCQTSNTADTARPHRKSVTKERVEFGASIRQTVDRQTDRLQCVTRGLLEGRLHALSLGLPGVPKKWHPCQLRHYHVI